MCGSQNAGATMQMAFGNGRQTHLDDKAAFDLRRHVVADAGELLQHEDGVEAPGPCAAAAEASARPGGAPLCCGLVLRRRGWGARAVTPNTQQDKAANITLNKP